MYGKCTWLDARHLIKTDMQHGQAKILWGITEENIQQQVQPLIQAGEMIITQGFIGATLNGKTTTLGREGSDFSAAIFSYCLKAEKMIVWKDVAGVLNADPKNYPDAVLLPQLSYDQAVQMTFYGATVIHPKTIQPLFTRNIPLFVRSFKDCEAQGTRISEEAGNERIPIYLSLTNQLLIAFTAKNFSFMDTEVMQELLPILHHLGVKVQAMQTQARTLLICTENKPSIIKGIESAFTERFHLDFTPHLTLETILYFTQKDLYAKSSYLLQVTGNILNRVV
jgi:aspartate kinase